MSVEVIKCRCGAIRAAIHASAIDNEWTDKANDYIRRGYDTEIIDGEFRFGDCTCTNNWNTIMQKYEGETHGEKNTATDLILWLEENYDFPNQK